MSNRKEQELKVFAKQVGYGIGFMFLMIMVFSIAMVLYQWYGVIMFFVIHLISLLGFLGSALWAGFFYVRYFKLKYRKEAKT